MKRVDYFQWAKRLVRLVRSMDKPQGTWYLRPNDDLVSPAEIEDLFSAIRTWWLSGLRSPYSAAALRERLRRLRPAEAIPLLYAMSYTARAWGRGASFWPQFCEHVLAGKVDLDVIRSVAPEFTNLWKLVHKACHGTLYYPLEGRSNIKWPLTHAGLLSDEEEVLDRFGLDLVSEWGMAQSDIDIHPLLLADVDEFQTALLTWLHEEKLGFRVFAKRLNSEHIGLTVAMMAQHYLRQNWGSLKQQEVCDRGPVRSRYRHIRPRFRYDAETNQLRVVLPEAQWPGRVGGVKVEHDGRSEIWPIFYSPSSNTTFSEPLEIPVSHSTWGPVLIVKIDDQTVSFPLIPSPFSKDRGAMLFDSLTGMRTRTVKPGEPYFLLLPTSQVDEEWRRVLFPEAIFMGNPFRDHGYALLEVTACELSTLLDEDRLDRLNDDLIDAGAVFRLPPFHELTRPQTRLVGGLPLVDRTYSAPLFHVEQPPMLEVFGVFPKSLPMALQRLRSGTYINIASFEIPESRNPSRLVIDLFSSCSPEPGRYRLLVGSESIDFRLGHVPTAPLHPYRLKLTFDAESQTGDGTDFGYHLLARGTFRGTAWPGAVLTVRVQRSGLRTDRFTRQLYAETDGSFAFRLADYYHGTIPEAPVEVAVETQLVCSNSIVFTERPYFRQWTTRQSESGVQLTGQVVQASTPTEVTAIAFGEAPWNGQIWHARGTVDSSGAVCLTFSCPSKEVRYVAVAERVGEEDELRPWLAVRVADAPLHSSPLRLSHGLTWTDWVPWMHSLAEFSGAEPEIRKLAKLSRARSHLVDNFPGLHPTKTVWSQPNRVLQMDLPMLLQFDSAPRAALIATDRTLPDAHPYGDDSAAPTPGVEIPPEFVAALLNDNLPSGGLPIMITEGPWRVEGIVRQGTSPLDLYLEAEEQLVICHDCGRILPRYGFDHHLRPSIYKHRLCHTLTPVPPGKQVAVTLAVECHPGRLAACVAELFAYTSRNRQLPPNANTSLFEWFKRVASHYPRVPGGPTPTRWGREVATAAGDLAALILYPNVPVKPARLVPLVAVFEQHPNAVSGIIARLLAWMGQGRAR